MASKFLWEQRIRIKKNQKKKKEIIEKINSETLFFFFFSDWSKRIASVIIKLLSLKVTIRLL